MRRPWSAYDRSVTAITAQSRAIERVVHVCGATTADARSLRHAILDEISKTLTLVQAYEGDFKQILQRKLGKRKS